MAHSNRERAVSEAWPTDEKPEEDWDEEGDILKSPADTHADNLFTRFRKSLRGNKEDKHAKCKEEILQLRREVVMKNKALQTLSESVWRLLYQPPYSEVNIEACQDVHVGDNRLETDPRVTETLQHVRTFLNQMAQQIEVQAEQRADTERRLKTSQVMLKEVQTELSCLHEKLDTRYFEDTIRLTELRTMLQDLSGDRSDKHVLTDCVTAFKEYSSRRLYTERDGFCTLPRSVQIGIRRLVNKFDDLGWREFAQVIGVAPGTVPKTTNSYHLDPESCALVLHQWITDSAHNDPNTLLRKIEQHEMDKVRARQATVTMETLKLPSDGDEVSKRSSLCSRESEGSASSAGGVSTMSQTLRRFASQQISVNLDNKAHVVQIEKILVEDIISRLDSIEHGISVLNARAEPTPSKVLDGRDYRKPVMI